MGGVERIDGGPRSVVVVGAGIAGLSTAWFLQERGIHVTVVDRTGFGAGASWGNAGWIAPGLILPLNSPATCRAGLRSLINPRSPLRIPLTADASVPAFPLRFAANCRPSSFKRAVRANVALNEEAIEAYDVLISNGVDVPVTDAPITALFRRAEHAERMLKGLRELENAGQTTDVTALVGAALQEQVPLASARVAAGLNINAQRFVDPSRFVLALGRAVVARGATLRTLEVVDVVDSEGLVTVHPRRGRPLIAEAAVIATGAQLPQLAKRWVRVGLQGGRGYSFTVPVHRPLPSPIYLPDVRVACTPYRGDMRVSGIMEFGHDGQGVIPGRVEAIAASAGALLDGVGWEQPSNLWVGARPITSDGRPLLGEVSPGVYVAGGHGMWGMAHGPVTGRLLAEQISTGKQPQALAEFDPRRGMDR